ncbi:hypothetical protein HYDPIDRAFT_110611 [Hydnomerulius pinastri MD-312]|nr:hypothetical protein HYDPIDRAFT_110611 [Hydnomerulius pinastri MD-312]
MIVYPLMFILQYELEKRKKKALQNQFRQPPPKTEDESLLVIDPNAPDALHADGPDFGWLDEACEVKGDRLDVTDEEDSEAEERESDDELYLSSSRKDKGKQKAQWRDVDMENVGDRDRPLPHDRENRAGKPLARFHSDWSIGGEPIAGPSTGVPKKRKHGDNLPGGSKFFKVKTDVGTRKVEAASSSQQKPPSNTVGTKATRQEKLPFPLAVDRLGHVKGIVTVGSRRKLNSKN